LKLWFLLIDNCIDMGYEGLVGNIGIEQYLREFQTVKIKTSRRAGHTTAIKKLVEHYSERKFLILGQTQKTTRELEYKGFDKRCRVESMSMWKFKCIIFRDFEFDTIIVDNASACSREDINNLYDLTIIRNNCLTIFIG